MYYPNIVTWSNIDFLLKSIRSRFSGPVKNDKVECAQLLDEVGAWTPVKIDKMKVGESWGMQLSPTLPNKVSELENQIV